MEDTPKIIAPVFRPLDYDSVVDEYIARLNSGPKFIKVTAKQNKRRKCRG
jgi:hypothetical protein